MNKIYYFTGTGNSLQIAEDLSGELGESSINKIAKYKLNITPIAEIK